MKIRTLPLVFATLMLAACIERDAARVDCGTPGPHGVDCHVARTGGNGTFEACWDLVITCQNGSTMTGAACHTMAAGIGEGSQNMSVAGFSDQDRCDAPASGQVQRLKIVTQ